MSSGPGSPAAGLDRSPPLDDRTKLDGVDDDTIRALLTRLARPHPSGGDVLERAAILAEGADFRSVMAWITAHGGVAETRGGAGAGRGLHGSRLGGVGEVDDRTPLRFVLPAGTLR